MNIVLKMSAADITRLVENFQAWAQPSANPYIQFLAKPQGCVITVYTSGKVMFQGEQAETYAAKFGYQETSSVPVQQTNIIGTDEVGNGSYFGGLAVVATYLSEADLPLIKKLGVDDSKKLTDVKIQQIAPILKEKIQHQALLLSPSKYNEVINSGYNAVSVKVALHNQAIFLLEQALSTAPDYIIIDAFTTEKNYTKYLQKRKEPNQRSGDIAPKGRKPIFCSRCVICHRARFISHQLRRPISRCSSHATKWRWPQIRYGCCSNHPTVWRRGIKPSR